MALQPAKTAHGHETFRDFAPATLVRTNKFPPVPGSVATALNVYATTQSLGGTVGQAYGILVTAAGLGASSFNVGSRGAAGVANNTTLNVYEILKAVNQQAVNGVLYNGNAALRDLCEDLCEHLNRAGE